MFLVNAMCCQAETSASDGSLVQRSLAECGVSECDREASTVGGSGPLGGLLRHKKYPPLIYHNSFASLYRNKHNALFCMRHYCQHNSDRRLATVQGQETEQLLRGSIKRD